MYEALGPNRYVIHYMLHDGAVSRCGRFTGEQLDEAMRPTRPPEVAACSHCAADEARETFKRSGQSR